MKRVMMLLACMFTVLLQGMENNTLSFMIDQTMVKLTKGSMFDADGTVDLMIVGRVQQRQLKEPTLGDSLNVGRIDKVRNNMVYIKNKDTDSASDDDTYKPYNTELCGLWEHAHEKAMRSRVLSVIEPRICLEIGWDPELQEEINVFQYCHANGIVKDGAEALEEAKKALALCYKKALLERLKEEKSIAIPALGTDVGFPREDAAPVAIATIIEYIKTSVEDGNVEPCELIHLFVKKRSDFARYKELLTKASLMYNQ